MATTNTPTDSTNPNSIDAILAEIEKLRAENAQLQARTKVAKVTLKRTEKGGLSVYGLGRYPVTLYREQWLKLLAEAEAIKQIALTLPSKADNQGTDKF